MSDRQRLVGLIGLGSVVLLTAAASALAYTGTPKGKKLAAELLASYKHVHYLAGSIHGSVYYCPSVVGGYAVETGYAAPSSCLKHPATASWVNTLSNGKGASAVGKVTSNGEPTITFVANPTATYIRAQGAKCWTKQAVDYQFVGYPPFAFFKNEHMTVGKKRNGRIQLIGTSSAFNGFKETDTLNAKTHQMIGESIYFGLTNKKTEDHLLTSYHTASSAPKAPRTTPAC